ncbi:PAS domain S-box protein [Niastella sp. OAS944]|uniref:PAS domain S-box protein n=1 Tax=Niastella sp. OAS944 TaxID=2664089 RepID=UPI003498F25D|nr:PAS domain S-box-containing protein [Chitinophagaceae bacterium OAS944]
MEVNALKESAFLSGGGEAGKLIRSIDWAANPAGNPANWPLQLQTAASIILHSHVPMFIAWGTAGTLLYNDASQPLITGSSKMAMGQPVHTILTEQWSVLAPAFEQALQGTPVILHNVEFMINRHGYREPVAFTFSCIPLIAATGEAGGILVTATENESNLATDQKSILDALLQLPIGMLVIKKEDHKIELANEAYIKMTGRHTNDLAGKLVFEGAPELQAPRFKMFIDQAMTTGVSYVENGMPMQVMRNGKLVEAYFNILFFPVQGAADTIDGVIIATREVTDYELERKRMENSENYFRRLADTVPVMLWITRPDGSCTYVNQKWYDYTGQRPEDTLGRGWLTIVHPDDADQMKTGFEEANARHVPFNLEYRIKGADGIYRWILDSGSPVFDKNGVFEGFIGSVVNIDQRKQAENAVRQREGQFRQLADSMPQIVWTATADGYVDYYNKQWYLLIGEENEFGNSSFLAHVHPDDYDRCLTSWLEVVRTGEPYEVEFRFRVKAPINAYSWFLVRARPIKNENGQIIKWYGTCTDIDEVKRIEHTLRESEERFRVVVNSAPVMVWMSDPQKRFTFFNKRWLEFTGRAMEQELWDGWKEGIWHEDLDMGLTAYHEAFEARRDFEVEFRMQRNDGEYRWIVCNGIPRFSYDGTFLGYIGSSIDIHERKTIRIQLENRVAERTQEISRKNQALEETTRTLKEINQQLQQRHEELRQSEERYLRMTNEVEDYAIILLSKEGLIENWNKGAEKIKGYTADEAIGKHFRIFYNHADQQHHLPEKLIEEASVYGKSTYEGWRIRKDGSTLWAYTVITALHNDKNDIIGFSKVTRDLTQRKLADDRLKMYAEQLEQKNRELERSNSELSSFSYVASHDLQEPLRKIQAFGNLIQQRDVSNLSDTSKDYFERMVKAAIRMQNLIDSLLEFSRTTTARKNFENTDLNALLDDVKKELGHRIEEKKAIIESSHLPTLSIIPFQFRQLLSNLISNSLKYSKEEITPVIEIKANYVKRKDLHEKAALPGKDYFQFSVADNGIGFEQEYAEKIFDLFQRLHGRNEYSGSGIGLAICKKIVENHHGFMRAESEPGQGATFFFFIPVK